MLLKAINESYCALLAVDGLGYNEEIYVSNDGKVTCGGSVKSTFRGKYTIGVGGK